MCNSEHTRHLLATVTLFMAGSRCRAIKRLNKARFNGLTPSSPAAYALDVPFSYCPLAGTLHVSPVSAAFLAEFAQSYAGSGG